MSLLDLPIRAAHTGLPARQLVIGVVRELGESDLPAIAKPPNHGFSAPVLQKVRHRHHTLARLIAEGLPGVEVSAITGFSQSRISILKNDPQFQELIAHYSAMKEAKFLDVHERIAELSTAVIEELRDRLEENPKSYTNRELNELMISTLDRGLAPAKGGPKGPGGSVNVQVQFVQAPEREAPGVIIEHSA